MSKVWMSVLESVYPVGSVYISTINTPPPTLFGFGEWEQIKDVFLLCAGDSYSGGDTGGEAAVTLTEPEMPFHPGHVKPAGENFIGEGGLYLPDSTMLTYGSSGRGWSIQAGNEIVPAQHGRGESKPHNNMPPYLTIYAWKRTA